MSEKRHIGKKINWWKKFVSGNEDQNPDSDDLTTTILTGNSEALRQILKTGINPDLPDSLNRLPIHFAAEKDRDELIRILLDRGANIHILDPEGNTALMIAARHGSVKAARKLLYGGINYFLENNSGLTALEIAIENSQNWICDLFRLKEKELELLIAKERNLQGALYSKNALKVLDSNAQIVRERLRMAGYTDLEMNFKVSSLPELELELRRLSRLLDDKNILRN